MKRLIRSELLKFRTTPGFFWTLIALPAAVIAVLASAIATAGRDNYPLDTVEGVRNVISGGASSGGLIVLILGILAMTGEYRHQTVTQTFLGTPVRGRVVAAKAATYALVGLAVALASGALTIAIGLPWLASKGAEVRIIDDIGVVLAGATACTVLYGALGVGVGALIRNQTTAIVISLAWVFLLEGVLVNLVPTLGRWLPAGAASALTSSAVQTGDFLPMWAAALVLGAYVVGFSVAGGRAVAQRDVA